MSNVHDEPCSFQDDINFHHEIMFKKWSNPPWFWPSDLILKFSRSDPSKICPGGAARVCHEEHRAPNCPGPPGFQEGFFRQQNSSQSDFQRQKSGFLPNQFTVINWFLRKENQQSHLLIYRSELRLSGFSPRPRMKVVSRWNWRHRTEDLIHDGFWVNIRPEVS